MSNLACNGPVTNATEQNKGRVQVEIRVESVKDLEELFDGKIEPAEVRTAVLDDALVDTGASLLSLPISVIRQLGLTRLKSRNVVTAAGRMDVGLYSPVRLTIQGRDCMLQVVEVPDGVPPLVGQLALEQLDFVVDMQQHKLVGNPRHGGEFVLEMY